MKISVGDYLIDNRAWRALRLNNESTLEEQRLGEKWNKIEKNRFDVVIESMGCRDKIHIFE